LRPWEALPDELEHQEFVKVSVEEGPRDRVQFPIMIVSAPSEINDHNRSTLAHAGCFGRLSVRRAVGRHAAGAASLPSFVRVLPVVDNNNIAI